MKALSLLAISALVVSGCGASQETAMQSRCSDASRALLDAIATGLTVQGGGSLGSGKVVRSDDFEEVYFVAAEIDGPGMQEAGDVGVWTTTHPQRPTGIFAVDGMAKEFSDWGDGGTTDAQLSMSDDGASEARACAGG